MNCAIILASGASRRMKGKDKLFLTINEKPLLYYSLTAINDHPDIQKIIVTANKSNLKKIKNIISEDAFSKIKSVVLGGTTRFESLKKGLQSLEKTFHLSSSDMILVHNAANPNPSFEEISACVKKAQKKNACIVGHHLTSTIKEVKNSHIIKTHDRVSLFAAETPQCVQFNLLKKAIINAVKQKLEPTDEAMLLENVGIKVAYIPAHHDNFKVTTEKDYARMKAILGGVPEDFLVGIGMDSHMFSDSEKGLVLGQVLFPNEQKLEANSDGDVVLHAIFNAISEAVAGKSLGFYADKMCEKGIKNSKKYLEPLLKKLKTQKLKLNNLGLMIEGRRPKIDPVVYLLKKSLSKILNLPVNRIGIAATTGESATVFGEGLGIQCYAIVSLVRT